MIKVSWYCAPGSTVYGGRFWRQACFNVSKMRTPTYVARYSSGKSKEQRVRFENRFLPRVQIRAPIVGHAEGASPGDSD